MVKERIANKRIIESSKKESLDAVITVPAYREGYAVIDMLHSIAMQKDLPKRFKHAVFVVINNSPNEPDDVYKSNMRTYTLLQALRNNKKIKLENKEDFDNEKHFKGVNKKIEELQQSNLEINIVDIFSDSYANLNNNVGLARQAVAEASIGYLKDDDRAIYVTTDADTMLDRNFLSGALRCFADFPELDALGGDIKTNINIVTPESKQAYEDNILYQQLSFYIHEFARVQSRLLEEDDPHYFKKSRASYLCGSATVVTKRGMDAIDGYHSIASAEDMQVGIDLREKGYSIADARLAPNVSVYTAARISDRTDKGFGRAIEGWSKVSFAEHQVMTFEAEEKRDMLMDALADIHEDEGCDDECLKEAILEVTNGLGLNTFEYEKILHAYIYGEVTPTLFTNTLLLGLTKQIFQQSQYTVPLSQYISYVEEYIEQSQWQSQWSKYNTRYECDGDLRKLSHCLVEFIKPLIT